MEKPEEVKIVQITAATNIGPAQAGQAIVYGLGSDGLVYSWSPSAKKWNA